jgi:hypothetical protein
MRLLMIKYGNIALTTTITLLTLYHICILFLVRLGGYIVNFSDFYSYRLIGKLTAFLQVQEFSLWKLTVVSSTSTTRLSLKNSKAGLSWEFCFFQRYTKLWKRQISYSVWTLYEIRQKVLTELHLSTEEVKEIHICWCRCMGDCLLLIDKARTKDKTYKWVSVRWKTKS